MKQVRPISRSAHRVLCLVFGCWLLGAVAACSGPEQGGGGNRPETRYPEYQIKPLKPYSMKARVLSRKDYRWDREADLSPTDLALGWGPMADPEIISQFRISQKNRWFYWRTPRYPIPRRDIESNAANVHIIPADDSVARKLEAVAAGDLLQLKGQLVEVRGADGWRWRSSLSFNDTGDGSCEVLLLEDVREL